MLHQFHPKTGLIERRGPRMANQEVQPQHMDDGTLMLMTLGQSLNSLGTSQTQSQSS